MKLLGIVAAVLLGVSALPREVMAKPTNEAADITRLEGEVYLLNYGAADRPTGPGPHYFFQGKHYSAAPAQPGDHLAAGNMIRTGLLGRARLVFNYGDFFQLGDNSFLKLDYDTRLNQLEISLVQGALRGYMRHGNTLSSTRLVTEGARATVDDAEFFANVLESGLSEFAVLRGSIAILIGTEVTPFIVSARERILFKQGKVLSHTELTRAQVFRIQSSCQPTYAALSYPTIAVQKNAADLDGEAYSNLLLGIKKQSPEEYKEFMGDEFRYRSLDGLLAYSIESVVKKVPLSLHPKDDDEDEATKIPLINPFFDSLTDE